MDPQHPLRDDKGKQAKRTLPGNVAKKNEDGARDEQPVAYGSPSTAQRHSPETSAPTSTQQGSKKHLSTVEEERINWSLKPGTEHAGQVGPSLKGTSGKSSQFVQRAVPEEEAESSIATGVLHADLVEQQTGESIGESSLPGQRAAQASAASTPSAKKSAGYTWRPPPVKPLDYKTPQQMQHETEEKKKRKEKKEQRRANRGEERR